MQTDGWPELDEGKRPELINEQDLLQAKTVILNWIKDLRAQPEVGNIQMTVNSFKQTRTYSIDLVFYSH